MNMKTMTCKQMGGPCDAQLRGNKADEVIKAQDKHLKEVVAQGDETHQSALESMQDRWKHPVSEWAGTEEPRRPLLPSPKTETEPPGGR
jgi:predicted small metal-binding protein